MARRRPHGRPVNGILLLDKPVGMTSNAALQAVKRLFRARKAGHTGSLDPLASGLLPICLGEATKVSAYLLDADKRYRVRVRLGVTTATGDADGEVLETRAVESFDAARLEAVLDGLRGEIDQIPPMYSALHHQGQRLYQLAREGIEVERAPRRITIHALEATAVADDELGRPVHCSKGTYVRPLAAEIGAARG
ncbi:MAG: tRNA pseudouridine(55) synthase TruB, partial [Gammaproteobacteria bacterium]|nr:tRNA pseudouridine(55) synthase TruB [Gammaproteobacteria bacterium]